jgi:putative intracellular protease/amidase
MQVKEVLLLLTDQWADWEAAYAIPIINSSDQYAVKTIALDKTSKVSIGGLRAEIDCTIETYNNFDNMAMLILPGGYEWKKGRHDEIAGFVKTVMDLNIPVAAICGATIFMGKHGFFDNIRHTGDELELFQEESGYNGQDFFVAEQTCVDKGVITANETAALEFGRIILDTLRIFTEEDSKGWYNYFKNGLFR